MGGGLTSDITWSKTDLEQFFVGTHVSCVVALPLVLALSLVQEGQGVR